MVGVVVQLLGVGPRHQRVIIIGSASVCFLVGPKFTIVSSFFPALHHYNNILFLVFLSSFGYTLSQASDASG